MTRVFWVRHGPTHAKGMVGWTDLPADLSDAAQVARLSAYLPASAVVVASTLQRASATADALQGRRTRLPDDPDLREMHFGDWEMKTSDEISSTHPDLSRAFWTDPGAARPPGGESWDDLTARTTRGLNRAMAAHPGADIVAVAHIGAILAQVAACTGTPPRDVLRHRIENLSVTELTLEPDGGWRLGRISHCP